ncbi:three-Cys-motif partner protein [Nocardioides luteus]|uniref:three-Cys-motif partner protein TcmP n=1 Tax=Nocardioides luteus TaxID=1844 RepID=UPI0028574D39|nr:three-Cys-motif partner protein TcmP [Nocardioides luteus]MDR7311316.1 three-Cys-motif partner protein [Nocardioides luteus]
MQRSPPSPSLITQRDHFGGGSLSSDTSKFHKSKKSAAVLKHAIINSYATPFGSKTGSTSKNNRVSFIDGYAGPGRYEDGSEGSGAMLLRKAKELAAMSRPRKVELHFVEDDEETVAKLRAVVEAEAEDVEYTITDGDISKHLPVLLDAVKDIPVFVYLDPCGLPIPLEEVAAIFDRPSGPGTSATEVLINLTASLRRFAGMLYSDKAVENSLKKLDAVCGGAWWRAAWLEKCPTKDASEDQKMAAELAVVEGYADKLRENAGALGTWIIDVRPRAGLKPLYYLVFATRSIHGMVTFGECASKGLEHWRKYHAEVAAEDDLFGSAADWEEAWRAEEKKLSAQWVDTLADRITGELAKGHAFKIIDRSEQILGDDLVGLVRTMHFRAAINKVLAAGKTTTDPKGVADVYNLLITPA